MVTTSTKTDKFSLKRILILDDEPNYLSMLRRLFAPDGYEVETTQDSQELLRKAAHLKPGAIVLDVRMPGIDGFEVCRALRGTDATRNIPVIFLSAVDTPESRAQALSAGGNEYISKANMEKGLRQKLEECLQEMSGQDARVRGAAGGSGEDTRNGFGQFKERMIRMSRMPSEDGERFLASRPEELYAVAASVGIDEEWLARALAEHAGLPYRERLEAGEANFGSLSPLFCEANQALPLRTGQGAQSLAVCNPLDHSLRFLFLQCLPGFAQMSLCVASPGSLRRVFTNANGSALARGVLAGGEEAEIDVTVDTENAGTGETAEGQGEYDALVRWGALSGSQLDLARELARRESGSVATVLMTRFGVPKSALLRSLAVHHRCRFFAYVPGQPLADEAREIVRSRLEVCRTRRFVPVEAGDRRWAVALADPGDRAAQDDIRRLAGDRAVEFRVGLPDDILAAIEAVAQTAQTGCKAPIRSILEELACDPETEPAETALATEASEKDNAIVRFVNLMIEEAHARGASDIHIEPTAVGSVAIRFRIDGSLRKTLECPRHYRAAIIARIKVMAGLDIAERRKPQSGKIPFRRFGGLDIELRVETFPTASGAEDAVLRILAAGQPRPLAALSLSPRNQEGLIRIIEQPYGLFLCVGPTGSGKTTTLHSALSHINREDVKIVTAEDPVEITQPGLRQVQINRRAGYSFAEALCSFLRADPDVIMIGEMRDLETATTGVEASLTGHLVMSTLHTNSAPETVTRLLDMGLDPYSFADALLGVLAQRLMRGLCPACRQPRTDSTDLLASLLSEYGAPDRLGREAGKVNLHEAAPGGCRECEGTGFRGRVPVHELMTVDDTIRSLIVKRAPIQKLRDAACADGMHTLRQDGIEKVLQGVTVMDEVRAVCSR